MNTLPVCLAVPELKEYSTSRLLELIVDDLANAIVIMLASGMTIRVLKKFDAFPIQTFYFNEEEVDEQFERFANATKGKGKKSIQEIQL